LVLHAQAQSPKFGVKAGMAISNCRIKSVNPTTETSNRLSVTGGVFVHIPIDKRFSLRPGIEVVSKGTNRYNSSFNSYSFTNQLRLSYLDFPINLLYEIPVRTNKLLFGGGPVLSFLLNRELNDGIANSDFGVNLMAGYEWPIGASLCINYTHGLKNVNATQTKGNKVTNYYFGITVAYWF
jgi:hypothetical protein